MNIQMELSTESIRKAITELRVYMDMIDEYAEVIVDILANDGADVARAAYGEFGVQTDVIPDGKSVDIIVSGDMPLIAEFGAGDATLTGGFENTPAEARPGSYSEQHEQQYSRLGFWLFGGQVYTEVPPRHGLLNAKQHIVQNSTEVAREVFGSD